MKKIIRIITCVLLVIDLGGCALIKPSIPADKGAVPAALTPYSGLKARIAVTEFDITAAKAARDAGSSLRQAFISALKDSGRFLIVDYPAVNAGNNGQEKPAEDAPPDLIITGILNEFEPQASGGSAGIGGGGGVGSGVLGGLLGTNFNKAHMALDIRIVAVSNSEVLASTHVQGQAADIEKARSATLIEAARYISQTIPQNYYKY